MAQPVSQIVIDLIARHRSGFFALQKHLDFISQMERQFTSDLDDNPGWTAAHDELSQARHKLRSKGNGFHFKEALWMEPDGRGHESAQLCNGSRVAQRQKANKAKHYAAA